jgi:hypothetical protein
MEQLMHISRETLSILKNFRDLNSNILISPGNVIKTLTGAKNVMSTAVVEENFPVEFGIWDLTSFLGTVSLFDDPDFDFHEKYVTITNGKSSKVKYFYSEPTLLTVPTKDVVMPNTVVSLTLDESAFSELKKAGSVLGLTDLTIKSDGSDVSATLYDKSNAGSNTYSISIDDVEFEDGAVFNFDFNIDNLRFIPGSYTVNIAEKIVSEFVNADGIDLTYWVALEATSSYTMETVTTGASV